MSSKIKNFQRINVAAVIINDSNEFLICKRGNQKKFLPGIWHFPGGKIEKNESNEDALKRELFEELGIKKFTKISNLNVTHDYPVREENHRTYFFFCETSDIPYLNNEENDEIKFVSLENLTKYINDRSKKSVLLAAKKALNENEK